MTPAPKKPFVLKSSITVINKKTSVSKAKIWLEEIETYYDSYFAEIPPIWTWDQVNDVDCSALIELSEIVRADRHPPLDESIITCFSQNYWRNKIEMAFN